MTASSMLTPVVHYYQIHTLLPDSSSTDDAISTAGLGVGQVKQSLSFDLI